MNNNMNAEPQEEQQQRSQKSILQQQKYDRISNQISNILSYVEEEEGGVWTANAVANWKRLAGRPPYNHWLSEYIRDPELQERILASLPDQFEGYKVKNINVKLNYDENPAPRLLRRDRSVLEDAVGRLFKVITDADMRSLYDVRDDEVLLYYHLPKNKQPVDAYNHESLSLINIHDTTDKLLLFAKQEIPNRNKRSKSGLIVCER